MSPTPEQYFEEVKRAAIEDSKKVINQEASLLDECLKKGDRQGAEDHLGKLRQWWNLPDQISQAEDPITKIFTGNGVQPPDLEVNLNSPRQTEDETQKAEENSSDEFGKFCDTHPAVKNLFSSEDLWIKEGDGEYIARKDLEPLLVSRKGPGNSSLSAKAKMVDIAKDWEAAHGQQLGHRIANNGVGLFLTKPETKMFLLWLDQNPDVLGQYEISKTPSGQSLVIDLEPKKK